MQFFDPTFTTAQHLLHFKIFCKICLKVTFQMSRWHRKGLIHRGPRVWWTWMNVTPEKSLGCSWLSEAPITPQFSSKNKWGGSNLAICLYPSNTLMKKYVSDFARREAALEGARALSEGRNLKKTNAESLSSNHLT